MLIKNQQHQRLIVILFFSIFLALGLMVFDDYGISWDEPVQRHNGILNYNYIVKGDPALLTFFDRDYGPVAELLLIFVEKIIRPQNLQGVYLVRHMTIFFIFFTGIWFFYKLGMHFFRDRLFSLLGCLFLILSPRIFGHSFFNSKDIPFMVVFIISIYTMIRWLERPDFPRIILHALACGILIDIRILGIFVFFLSSFLFFWKKYGSEKMNETRYLYRHWIFFCLFFTVFMILLWPYLWKNPFGHLVESFVNMSQFRWEGTVLYFGKHIPATDLPWHYPLVWIFISTPLLYILTAVTGFVAFSRKMLSSGLKQINQAMASHDMILFIWFTAPLVAVMVLGSVLYDGWRHFYFIYPALILFSVRGIQHIWNMTGKISLPQTKKCLRWAFVTIALAGILFPLGFMIRFHPFQNIYFNCILRGNLEWTGNHFDMDYWGLSYRQGLEYIAAVDKRPSLPVYVENTVGRMNALMLPLSDRKRFRFVRKPEEAVYYITVYRWQRDALSYPDEIFSVNIGGARILSVFKLNNTPPG